MDKEILHDDDNYKDGNFKELKIIECVRSTGTIFPPTVIFPEGTILNESVTPFFSENKEKFTNWKFIHSVRGSDSAPLWWLQNIFKVYGRKGHKPSLLLIKEDSPFLTTRFILACSKMNVQLFLLSEESDFWCKPLQISSFGLMEGFIDFASTNPDATPSHLHTKNYPMPLMKPLLLYASSRLHGLKTFDIRSGFKNSGIVPCDKTVVEERIWKSKEKDSADQNQEISTSSNVTKTNSDDIKVKAEITSIDLLNDTDGEEENDKDNEDDEVDDDVLMMLPTTSNNKDINVSEMLKEPSKVDSSNDSIVEREEGAARTSSSDMAFTNDTGLSENKKVEKPLELNKSDDENPDVESVTNFSKFINAFNAKTSTLFVADGNEEPSNAEKHDIQMTGSIAKKDRQ